MIDRIIELVNKGYTIKFMPEAFPEEIGIMASKDDYHHYMRVATDRSSKYPNINRDRVLFYLNNMEREIEAKLMEKNGLLIKVTDHYGIVYLNEAIFGPAYHIRRLDDPENSITARRHKGEAERECKYLEALNYGVVHEPGDKGIDASCVGSV